MKKLFYKLLVLFYKAVYATKQYLDRRYPELILADAISNTKRNAQLSYQESHLGFGQPVFEKIGTLEVPEEKEQ